MTDAFTTMISGRIFDVYADGEVYSESPLPVTVRQLANLKREFIETFGRISQKDPDEEFRPDWLVVEKLNLN